MLTHRTLTVWTGIILVSSMFLMGQQAGWAPSDLLYCQDLDGDGYGVRPALLCPFVLYLDCDDSDPWVNPGVIEAAYGDAICMDGVDNDCDGLIDINDNQCRECSQPTDCDDGNPCTDDDCTGFVCSYTYNTLPCDDGDPCTTNDTCSAGGCMSGPLLDGDTDGYVSDACPTGDDCLDSNPNVNPGATEGPAGDGTCTDGLDNDCDGLTDEAADPDCIVIP
jgi:hypothetical protein